MKLAGLILLVGLAVVSASPQGFFGGLRNFFGGGRGRGRGRPAANNNNGGGGCRSSGPNHNFQGRDYLVTWRLGCTSFTRSQGAAYCRAQGMRPISLDTPAKEREFTGLVSREGQKYFWTGGNVNHRARTVSWPSGRTTSSNRWSNTGGANRPQPDNREGDESCLAVLNNFYNDGVRFHDVSCHHRKPIICEA